MVAWLRKVMKANEAPIYDIFRILTIGHVAKLAIGRPLSTQEETARLAAKEKYKPMATYHHHYGKVMWHPPEDLKMVLLDHGNIESPGGTVTWWLEGYGPNEQRRSSKERAPSNANSARADSPVARPSTEGL